MPGLHFEWEKDTVRDVLLWKESGRSGGRGWQQGNPGGHHALLAGVVLARH